MASPKYTIHRYNIKPMPCWAEPFPYIWQYIIKLDLHVQSKAKVHVTGNVYRHNPYTHYIGKNTFDFTVLVTEHAQTESANSSIKDACSWRQRLQRQ